jgi:pimeloyl-ACP methyl ester carboxylesterase
LTGGLWLFVVIYCYVLFPAFCEATPHAGSSSSNASNGTDSAIPDCKIVYAGFVGAMETSNHKHSGVVQIRDTLRGPGYADVCAESFIPISWTAGRDWILTHFPSHAGPLTAAEIAAAPRVILVGHSTGGWAMFSVARDLRDKAIPVELTVQVDSVGLTDSTVPRNVKTCVIFHAWDVLMFMTTKKIRMEDPLHTKLLANILVKHASHLSVTRDPRIREFVLNAVAVARVESASYPAVPAVGRMSSTFSPAGALTQPN